MWRKFSGFQVPTLRISIDEIERQKSCLAMVGWLKLRTFEFMLHKRHWVVVFASIHLLDAGTETRDGQDNDIANLLRGLHACEVLPSDIALASAHVKEIGIVKEIEDNVGPKPRASKLDNTLVVLAEFAVCFALESFLRDVCYDVYEDRVTRFRLNCPLAELNSARIPFGPVWAVWISLDTNNHAIGVAGNIVRNPICSALQCRRVYVRVNAATSEQNQIAEEVGLEYGKRKREVCLEHLGNGCIEVSNEVNGDVVSDDLVHERRVMDSPASFGLAEVVRELALLWGVLPRLPNVGWKLCIHIVGKLIFELLPQRALMKLFDGYLCFWLLGWCFWCVEGLWCILV
jgi:hypothetical protein